ncbi:hypothetical protein GCM10012275_08050 [Longimycelium tulufanense]|uniref:Phage tail protein n=1 Tax=Longimycelium tulufanense TaxID=907463 RepID=A0A8J3CAK2_9PSEU|nr:hypothetical protein [Longimycelium tulufanense]GGM39558.1 hypothetical protein GCM10012275_08050 [Longimycelium tulufanense]
MVYSFNNAAVRVATTGAIYFADDETGTRYDTLKDKVKKVDVALADTDFQHLGFLSEDAVEHEFDDDIEDIPSWQGGIVRSIVKSRSATFKIASLETSREALSLFYGADVTTDTGVHSLDVGANVARKKMICVFEFRDGHLPSGTERVYRIVLPSSQVTELESPKFTAGDAVTWGMTIKALGSRHPLLSIYTNDDQLAAPAPPPDTSDN